MFEDLNVDYLRREGNDVARNYYSWKDQIDQIDAFRHIYVTAKLRSRYPNLFVKFLGNLQEWVTGESDAYHNKGYYNNAIGLALGKYASIYNLSDQELQLLTKYLVDNEIAIVEVDMAKNPKYDGQDFNALFKTFDEVLELNTPYYQKSYTDTFFSLQYVYINNNRSFLDNLSSLYNKAKEADGITTDPIIFDLDGDGLSTTSIENGIYFDHENDGFKEASSWVGGNDGILFLDHNENQLLDNGSELISFNDLLEYDSNGDGVIDKNDEIYSRLKIQKADGTYLTVEEAGIISININTKNTYYTDENGNKQFASGYFKKEDGTELEFGAFMVETNPTNSYVSENITIAEDILELPYIDCYGKLYNLHQAMMKDETGELKALVEQFVSETNDDERMNLVDRIFEKWVNTENIEEDLRGEYINAKRLAVVEAFMGSDFISTNENEINPQKPNKEASQILNTLYINLKLTIYSLLMAQTHLEDLFVKIKIDYNYEKNHLSVNFMSVIEDIKMLYKQDSHIGKQVVYEFSKLIKGLELDTNSNFFDPKDDNCFYTTFTKNDRELKWLIDSIGKVMFNDEIGDGEGSAADDAFRAEKGENFHFHSLSGDDVVYGDSQDDNFATCSGDDLVDAGDGNDIIDTHGGNDIIFAGAGDDIVHAADGDDIIMGGDGDDKLYPDHGDDFSWGDGNDIVRGDKGNDTIVSMRGDDTFIFNPGDGQDTIIEKHGVDTLYFGKGITWQDLIFEQSENDMIIKIEGSNDQITVKDWFKEVDENREEGENYKIEIFEFSDGSKHYKDEITIGDNTDFVVYDGLEYDEYVELPSNYKTEVNMHEGNDYIVAGKNSNDTYIYNLGDGFDTIEDTTGNNKIKFGEGITTDNIIFERNRYGLQIWFQDIDGGIFIRNEEFEDDSFTFEFADGSIIDDIADYIRRDEVSSDYDMGERQDEINIIGNNDVTVTGNDKDNRIIDDSTGNVTIEAGLGNDEIESNRGANNTYIYNLGDGEDRIRDWGGQDTLQFGEGITPENIFFLRNLETNELEIWFNLDYENNDRITIENFFSDDGNNRIENFVFSDGTVINNIEEYIRAYGSREEEDITIPDNITEAHLRGEGHISATGNDMDNQFIGNFGDNTFIGGKGNDNFWDDQGGADKFIYNLGDGHDNIDNFGGIDSVIFGDGITLENTTFTRDENGNLIINFADNEEDSIFIGDYFNDDNRKIELFKFADGTVLSDIEEYINNGTQNTNNVIMEDGETAAQLQYNGNGTVVGNVWDNIIIGNAGNNSYHGGGGNDTILDMMGGDDTYYYNVNNGHDEITDIGGYDKIKFGHNINPDDLYFEMDNNDLVISFKDREGSLVIKNYFADDRSKIECFEFEDGTVIEDISDRLITISTNQDYEITEDLPIENVVMTGKNDITVTGDSRDNVIIGNSGNNTVEGKGGNDFLVDQAGGDDTYIYNLGDGNDTIYDLKGTDTIKFGEGITLENLAFMQTENDLNIWFMGIDNDGLSIRNYFTNPDNKIERFELADGTVITDISNMIRSIGSDKDIILPDGVMQANTWGDGNISVVGNDMDNWIGGNEGNNKITGGRGNDYLYDDQGGDDTYIYNLGDGYDTINDFSGQDTIRFGYGISKENLVFIYNDGHLVIQFKDNDGNIIDGNIRIEDYFNDGNKRIEKLEFADGSVITDVDSKISVLSGENDIINYWDLPEIQVWTDKDVSVRGSYTNEIINGGSGNNTYDPQGGNDTIYDTQGGNDTYIYNQDYENKYIVDIGGDDTIKFGSGVNFEDTKFIKGDNGNLYIYFQNLGNAYITIEGYFNDDEHKIEHFVFPDGTVIDNIDDNLISGVASENNITLEEGHTEARLLGSGDSSVQGNSENNNVIGNSGNNTYNMGRGDDYIEERNGGDDTYIYNIGDGWDNIFEIGGNDTIKFGDGITLNDLKFTNNHNNLQIFIEIGENGGCINIENYFKGDLRKIERIELADGTVIEDVTPYISGITIDTDHTLEEDSQITDLYLKGSDDLSVTGNSRDNHFEGNIGNNTFEGRGGNDDTYDPDGDDTYVYNLGDGDDFYNDENGYDTLRLGEGITEDMIRMERQDNGNLLIYFEGQEGSICICEHFWNDNKRLEKIILADGTEITDFNYYLGIVETDQDYEMPEDERTKEVYVRGDSDVTAIGNSLDNHFEGNIGNNTFEGRGGNDDYYDEEGNETYVYNLGDGFDFINDRSGYDVIRLGDGITQDMIRMRRQPNGNLDIWFDGHEGNITVCDYFNNLGTEIEKIILADGTEITDFEQFFTFNEVSEDYVLPEDSDRQDIAVVGDGDVSVDGNSQDNFITGNSGNNTYKGNAGNDNFNDDIGDETYIYNLGDGYDYINDRSGYDAIRLGEGITRDMIRMDHAENGGLEIRFEGQEGNIVIQEYFSNDDCKIEKIILADGTEITDFSEFFVFVETDQDYTLPEDSFAYNVNTYGNNDISLTGNSQDNGLYGNDGNNTYEGRGGNDNTYDPNGDDTYVYNLGDGDDFYNDDNGYDTLRLGEGITEDMIRMERQDNGNLLISFEGQEGSICICEHFWNDNKRLEKIILADGTEITDFNHYLGVVETDQNYEMPEDGRTKDVYVYGENDVTVTGNSLDNHIEGNSGNNTYEGRGGNDNYHDPAGDDVYIYNQGDGWDYLRDESGNDVIRFGEGLEIRDFKGMIHNGNNLELSFNNHDGNIVIEDFFTNDNCKIERFEFADGSVITDVSEFVIAMGSDNDIVLPDNFIEAHMWGENNINATGNDHDNWFGGNSGDNIVEGRGGNDHYWDDQGGNDTLIYNIGDGDDTFENRGGYDTIQFGEGITQDMIRMERYDDNEDIRIYFEGIEGSIYIRQYFSGDPEWKIERLLFADGSEITDFNPYLGIINTEEDITIDEESNIRDVYAQGDSDITMVGNSRNNHFEGNNGNNTFKGGGGNNSFYDDRNTNETYIHNIEDGWDYITDIGGYDKVVFGEGLNKENMKVAIQNGRNLEIWFDGIDGNLVIEDYFCDENKRIERFEFADGSVIENMEDYLNVIKNDGNIELPDGYLEAHLWGNENTTATGNDNDNWFNGNPGNNIVEGKGGNDNYWDDQGGDDTLIYNIGDGDDIFENRGGYDTIQFGEGITKDMIRMERYDDNEDIRIYFEGIEGSIYIRQYFSGDPEWKIERLLFADGSEITDFNPYLGIVDTDQDIDISDNENIKDINVTGNNDVSIIGNAQNNHVNGNEANNTYDLKGGNDNIYDPNGDDTYIYNRNDENLNIDDKGGFDTIKLGEGITEDQIGYMIDDANNIHIRISDNNGDIVISNQNSDGNSPIEQIELADGTIINDINSRINQIGTSEHDIELPDGYTEGHLWGDGNFNITGNDSDNFIRGNAGDNILNGKGGNDYYWEDEGGNDTYIYNIGDGNDNIEDINGYDKIKFGDGITAENIRFERQDNNLNIHFDGFDGSININGYFNEWEDRRIEEFVFSDGSSINDVTPFLNNYQKSEIYVSNSDFEITGNDNIPPYDVNDIIQQMNSYAPDTDAVMTDSTLTQEEQILLAMAS